jgi:hypothetical protein
MAFSAGIGTRPHLRSEPGAEPCSDTRSPYTARTGRITRFPTNTTGRPSPRSDPVTARGSGPGTVSGPARAAGLRNLPLHDTAQNRVWLEVVQTALDLLAWMPMLALNGQARLWDRCRLRLRLLSPDRG